MKKNRTAYAKFRQREHGEDIGEQSVDSQVGLSQGCNKDSPHQKLHNKSQKLPQDAGGKIIDGILRAGFLLLHVPSTPFSRPYSITP